MICMTLTSKLNYLNQSLKLIESQFILIIIIILYSFTCTSVLCDPATAVDSIIDRGKRGIGNGCKSRDYTMANAHVGGISLILSAFRLRNTGRSDILQPYDNLYMVGRLL